jgi:hypothetical protein
MSFEDEGTKEGLEYMNTLEWRKGREQICPACYSMNVSQGHYALMQ